MEIPQDGVLYISTPVNGFKLSNDLVISVEEMVGKKYFSINSGPFTPYSRSEHWPEDLGHQGIVASCNDGYFSVHSKFVEKSRELSDNISIGSDGSIIVEKEILISCNKISDGSSSIKQTCAGKEFSVGLSNENSTLYSWGKGMHGQLGQGTAKTAIDEPKHIPIIAAETKDKIDGFVAIAAGESFAMALDIKGRLYSWGENFDRQLGIYTKSIEKMEKNLILKNCLIEDVVFVPRVLPFSLKNPIVKVACGNRFAVAIAASGSVYTWGAGECGQLGTGRCTNREIPAEVSFGFGGDKVIDVACGSGHVIALLERGTVCGWGLNKSGQLGLGDTATKFAPERGQRSFAKIFANGNSSAAIDHDGQLFTWGSRAYNRLLLPAAENMDLNDPKAPSCEYRPRQVQLPAFKNTKIASFVFCKYSSGVLILSTAMKITPTRGPKRSFSKLEIHGCGFWNSPTIIIKFSSKIPSIYNPPRSCVGTYTGSGVITCKPPKFVETGVYIVTISMDGTSFLPQSFEINIYKDANIVKQFPAIVGQNDLKSSTIKLTISGPISDAGDIDFGDSNKSSSSSSKGAEEFDVKLIFFRSEFDGSRHHKDEGMGTSSGGVSKPKLAVHEVSVKGKLEKKAADLTRLHRSATAELSSVASDNFLEVEENRTNLDHEKEKAKVDVVSTAVLLVDLSRHLKDSKLAFLINALTSSSLPPVFEMKCIVSLNGGQDYCPINNDAAVCSIVHNFSPVSMLPCCLSAPRLATALHNYNEGLAKEDNDDLDALRNALEDACKLKVTGKGFVPTMKLPKGTFIESVLLPILPDNVKEALSPEMTKRMKNLVVPVNCDSFENLSLTLTTDALACILDLMTLDVLDLQFRFRLFSSPIEGVGDIAPTSATTTPLSDDSVTLFLYNDMPCGVSPIATTRNATSQTFKLGITTDSVQSGFPFQSNDTTVSIHYPYSLDADNPSESQELLSVQVKSDRITFSPWTTTTVATALSDALPNQSGDTTCAIFVSMESLADSLVVGRHAITSTTEQAVELIKAADFVYLSVSLDGKSLPPLEKWAKIFLHDDLSSYIVQPVPKGGAVSGSTVSLQLQNDRPLAMTATSESGQCFVRLRGSKEDMVVSLPGSLARHEIAEPKDPKDKGPPKISTKSAVSFLLPDIADINILEPVVQGKERFLFADVSVDGGLTYCSATTPKLQVK